MTLPIVVGNVNQLMGLGYSAVQVFCSSDQGNSFQEITAASASHATLTALPPMTTYQMGGKLLKFKLDGGTEVSVTFDPLIPNWTPTQVANRINQFAAGRASVVSNNLVLASATTGRTSSVVITYNDATSLGWSDGTSALGQDIRIPLVSNTYFYGYIDLAGVSSYRYQWRFTNSSATQFTDFSDVIYGNASSFVATNALSLATATFVNIQGVATQMTVLVAPADGTPMSIGGLVVGEVATKMFTSDVNGFLAIPLMRGAKVRVAIEGTTLVREFVVPNTATFDLLATMGTAPDAFTIQTVPALLTRRNP